MGSTGKAAALAGVCLALVSGVAFAQGTDAVTRARTHFEAGRALYNLGNYTDSIREFSAGYQLVPKPQFLLNLGQCYRKLGELERAQQMYRQYLATSPATDPERSQVDQLLTELERELRDRPPRPSSSLLPSDSASATPVRAKDSLTVAASPPSKPSFLRRHWWIIPVSGVVVAGLAVGIYFAAKPADCAASIACLDVHR